MAVAARRRSEDGRGHHPPDRRGQVERSVDGQAGPAEAGDALTLALAGAANFAWNEFIALNWPAVTQNGQPRTRDMPDTTAHFGDPSHQGPLVWHTYRNKVEIFPGTGNPPEFGQHESSNRAHVIATASAGWALSSSLAARARRCSGSCSPSSLPRCGRC